MNHKNVCSLNKGFFLSLSLISLFLYSSCADSKEFVIDGELVEVEPYGFFNQGDKNEDIVYEQSTGNFVWSIILSETVIVPIWLSGFNYYEPVSIK